jgi:hypothetical protein
MDNELPFGLRVEKLTNPTEQVGLPAAMKWAVMSDKGFQDAFRTKREAEALKEELLTRERDALAKRLIGEVVAEERVRELTKELLVDHNRRCRACPTCVELKELLAKL